ncbi:hypothetical protein Btru_009297 [Bulinus truncatus]|nr:hypothetical protein Btru_009297 [Bulinus truncatus]
MKMKVVHSQDQTEASFTCRLEKEGAITYIDLVWKNDSNIVVKKNEIYLALCSMKDDSCKTYHTPEARLNLTQKMIFPGAFHVTLVIYSSKKNFVDGEWSLDIFRNSKNMDESRTLKTWCRVFEHWQALTNWFTGSIVPKGSDLMTDDW